MLRGLPGDRVSAQAPGAGVGLGVVGKSLSLRLLLLLVEYWPHLPKGREAGARQGVRGELQNCPVPCARPVEGQMEKDSMVRGPSQEGLCPCTRACSVFPRGSPDPS